MSKEDLLISSQEHFRIYCGDHDQYETIKVETESEASWRHGYGGYMIFKDPDTGKFYQCAWRNSSNEMNGWEDMNYGDQRCYEVKPKKEVVTTYPKVKDDPEEDEVYAITLTSIKDPEVHHQLKHHLDVSDELLDKYLDVGEYMDLELTFDEKLNIVDAKLLEQ